MDQAPISFFLTLVKKTLKGEIYRSRPGTVDRQYHYQVMTVELIDEQLAMMGLEPPMGLAIKQEDVEDNQVSELLLMRDRVLVKEMLLDAAVARYSGITSKLLLDEDSINGSVDVGARSDRQECKVITKYFLNCNGQVTKNYTEAIFNTQFGML
jgi:hypothetical protein